MNQSLARRVPSESERFRELIREAVRASFPLFTFKELKRLIRCEYHGLVTELREGHTWDELSALTGMTRAGLNKLGDTIPPQRQANAMRVLYTLVERAGEDGLTLGELAGSFYDAFPSAESAPELRQALSTLLEADLVQQREDRRYIANDREIRYSDGLVDSMVETVEEIATRVCLDGGGDGPERMLRVTLRVSGDPEAAIRAQERVEQALLDVSRALEAEVPAGDQGTTMVFVLAGSPDAP